MALETETAISLLELIDHNHLQHLVTKNIKD
jgi:hypothetical protein